MLSEHFSDLCAFNHQPKVADKLFGFIHSRMTRTSAEANRASTLSPITGGR